MNRRRAVAMLGVVATLAACNAILGLEELPVRPDAVDAADAGAETDAAGEAQAAPSRCTTDAECVHPSGCHTGTCDKRLGACVYRLCPALEQQCLVGQCNRAVRRCEGGDRHAFRAGGYALTGVTLGCAAAQSCVSAIHPFLFVGTGQDVRAFRVDDLTATLPAEVPLSGASFRPASLVASGRRLWIVGEMVGAAAPFQLTVTSVDIPSDPDTAALGGHTTTFVSALGALHAVAAPDGDLFLVHNDAARGLPAARLRAGGMGRGQLGPLPEGGANAPTHPMFPVPGLDAGVTLVVAATGPRLLAFRAPSTFNPITDPATALAKLEPDQQLQPPTGSVAFPAFVSGGDGVVVASFPRRLPPPECNCVTTQRVQWIVQSSASTAIDANQFVDHESYANPMTGGCNVCAAGYFDAPSVVAYVDPKRALVAAPARDPVANRVTTAVRLITRDPLAAPPTRRLVTSATEIPRGDFATEKVALAASAGVGYLVRADATGAQTRVDIIDPECDAP